MRHGLADEASGGLCSPAAFGCSVAGRGLRRQERGGFRRTRRALARRDAARNGAPPSDKASSGEAVHPRREMVRSEMTVTASPDRRLSQPQGYEAQPKARGERSWHDRDEALGGLMSPVAAVEASRCLNAQVALGHARREQTRQGG